MVSIHWAELCGRLMLSTSVAGAIGYLGSMTGMKAIYVQRYPDSANVIERARRCLSGALQAVLLLFHCFYVT